jgi:hypothetical protein
MFRTAVLAGASLFLASAAARAQATGSACLATLPDSALRRVAVFISNDSQDSAPALVKPADLLTDIIAERVRKILGAKPGELPMGEPTLSWHAPPGELRVTIHRDGSFSGAMAPAPTRTDTASGTRLLYQALLEASNEGERVFWPDTATGDSAGFRIVFWSPVPRRDGSPASAPVRFASAAFTMGLPWEEPVSVISMPKPNYPSDSRAGGVQGYLVLRFVVDENGVLDPATLYDEWPRELPPPTGLLKQYYREFVDAAKGAALKGKYRPALAGGCPMKQRVRLPFEFQLAH